MKQLIILMFFSPLIACATLTADKEQIIRIITTPEAGASCTVSNGESTFTVEPTPGDVTIPRSFAQLRVSCAKDALSGRVTSIEAGTRNRAYGNLLLLGVPAVVDAASGAGYEYPDTITIPLSKKK